MSLAASFRKKQTSLAWVLKHLLTRGYHPKQRKIYNPLSYTFERGILPLVLNLFCNFSKTKETFEINMPYKFSIRSKILIKTMASLSLF